MTGKEKDCAGSEAQQGPMRKCVVTGQVRAKLDMIRFVLNPDGQVVPDLAGKLPGRGVWLTANGGVIAAACQKNAFLRGFPGKKVTLPAGAPESLIDNIVMLQLQRVKNALGLCRRAGALITGFDKVSAGVKAANAGDMLIIAHDAGADGTAKLTAVAAHREVEVMAKFDTAFLSSATGFEAISYLFVSGRKASKSGSSLIQEIKRYQAFLSETRLGGPEN